MNNLELRSYDSLETRVREQADKPTVLSGHAAVFNVRSYLMPPERTGPPVPFYERILPGAFSESLQTRNVFALVGHDKNRVLGSTKSGTLKLQEDETGLAYEITLPDTSYARDLIELCKRGDLTTCSFGFGNTKGEISQGEGGHPLRTLSQIQLGEVSVGVFMPAYDQTSMQIRSIQEWIHDRGRASKLNRLNSQLKIIDL